MNDKLLLQECDHILWEGGYSYNVTEKLERIIAKVQDDVALMHAIELMEAIEQEHAKTIKACLAAVQALMIPTGNHEYHDEILRKAIAAIKEMGETCEHGKGLTDYCEPCGRIHGGG